MSSGAGTLVRMGVLALLWGSTFLWIKVALRGFEPGQVTILRCVLGGLTLLALARLSHHALPRDRVVWRHLAVAGLFGNAVPYALFSLGEQTVSSGMAGVLNATTPLWQVAIGLLIGTERGLTAVRASGLGLGFVGVLLILAPWQEDDLVSWGSVAILAAAVSYAVGFAYSGLRLVGRGTAPVALSASQLVMATGWTALTLPVTTSTRVDPGVEAVVAVVVLGVFGTGLTFALYYRLIADEGPTNAATVTYLLPVVSVALGAVVLGEDLSARVLLGMTVVLVAVALTRRQRPRLRAEEPPARSLR